MDSIYIFGDSNVRFFKESITGWHDFISKDRDGILEELQNKPETYFSGNHVEKFNNLDLFFIWQTRFPTSRLNKKYLIEKLEKTGKNPKPGQAFVFEYGRVDIQLKIKSISEVDEIVRNYIRVCVDFSKNFNATPYFCSALIPESVADKKIIQYFNNSLAFNSELGNYSHFIDLEKIVGYDFQPESWDIYSHTNKEDSKKCLMHIIDSVTLNQ
jgi:hypothetical protein